MTIHRILNRFYLQIDGCSSVIQTRTLLETIRGMKPKEVRDRFQGLIVLTNYGNNRTYRIEEILYNENPLDTFEREGASISYQDYFKMAYGVAIKDLKQPLVRVISHY